MPLEGAEKKRMATKRLPAVRVMYEKSKKPEPLVCRPGGETKMHTKSRTHQMKLMRKKRTVRYLRKRTVQRL
jgi:hypothetical protein